MFDVFWWSRVKENNGDLENFGDYLVPYLLDRTTTEDYNWRIPNNNRVLRIFKKKMHYIIIGSILRRATEHSIIWGAGIMFPDSKVPKAKFLAVRGPLTRKRLLDLGYAVPEKYGDPALLICLFNPPKKSKKYKIGIAPHFLDFDEVEKLYKSNKEFKIINLLSNDPQKVIDEINDCEKILSSSLHGIIIAHALNIPALWIKISDKLRDDIKFYDYFESMKLDHSIQIEFKEFSLKEIEILFKNNPKLVLPKPMNFKNRIDDLVETFPFKKTQNFENLYKEYCEDHPSLS